MVKSKNQILKKTATIKDLTQLAQRLKKINVSTAYDTCSEQLSPFGGLLPLNAAKFTAA